MLKRPLFFLLIILTSLLSCEDSNTEFPEQEVTLFDKTWIASNGVESTRYRLNSDGTYNGGNDEGFPNQGTWNWVSDAEEVMRISYDNTVIWYRFEDLTSNSVRTFTSEVQPYEWDEGVLFSLSD
jgi:hypothetical protein